MKHVTSLLYKFFFSNMNLSQFIRQKSKTLWWFLGRVGGRVDFANVHFLSLVLDNVFLWRARLFFNLR